MQLPKWFSLKPQEDPVFAQEYPETPEEAIAAEQVQEAPCHHQWRIRTASYAPPRRDIAPGEQFSSEVSSMVLFGVTTIVDECQHCQDLRNTTMLGNPYPQLDELLTKTTEYGPQYIERDGITYCIQRYIPPPQPVGLPLR